MSFEGDSPTVKKIESTSDRAVSRLKKASTSNNTCDASQVASTNVSSPAFPPAEPTRQKHPVSRTGVSGRRRVVVDSEDEDANDDFAPSVIPNEGSAQSDSLGMPTVRRRKPTERTKNIGTPITTDSFTSNLNPYELDIMNRFVADAKKLRGEMANSKGLRNESVFTDTILRRIGVVLPTSKSLML